VMRYETKFIQSVPVDPAIVALFGITQGAQVLYTVGTTPTVNARLSRTFRKGVASLSGGRSILPGNGLFLTSVMNTGMASYTYTGLRRWSMDASLMYSSADSQAGLTGQYSDLGATFTVSRQISRGFHAIAGFGAHKYASPTHANYNHVYYMARIGFGWTPGDVPLRVW